MAALSLMAPIGPHIAGRRVVVTGHSLGGSVAILLAALLVEAGTPPVAVVAFEPARSGMRTLAARLTSVSGTIYRYGDDPVPDVPPWPYVHPWEVTQIGHPKIDPISCHAIGGVINWLSVTA
jgi:acetyl esterase/lipase